MKRTLSVLVEDESGVLTRVGGLFARRGFNIDSLAVGPTEQPAISRITMVVPGDNKTIEQLTKQLYKLINVLYVKDITDSPCVERELVLIKVKAPEDKRLELIGIADVFRGKIVNMSESNVIIEITGDPSKVLAIEEILRPFGILEIARTGKVALIR